jgi:ADP-ribose pyrophosphatase
VLEEELGVISGRWTQLLSGVTDANRGCGVGHLYLARDCQPVLSAKAAAGHDDLEAQCLVRLKLSELKLALRQGQFKVTSWACCVAMALAYLD